MRIRSVTFGLAIVLQEVVKYFYGANPRAGVRGQLRFRAALEFGHVPGYPIGVVYFGFLLIMPVFASCNSPPSAWWSAQAWRTWDVELGIDIDQFTIMFGIATIGGACGRDVRLIGSFQLSHGHGLGASFVVVVVGGMGSLPGAVLAGFLLGILESLASMNEIKSIIYGIDQIIIYVVAIVILLVRPRGLMGRRGVMEE